jgi:D-glycero-D-manno-heptose 1,7-bisphosphate phosphatase
MNKAVIFDRDGVINELVRHGNQFTAPYNLSELRYLPKVIDAVNIIKNLGFLTFIATNQPNLSLCQISAINNSIKRKLGIDEVYAAVDQKSNDYKPGTGLFEKIIDKHKIDISKSYLIGDRWKDIIPGYKTGFTTIYIGEKYYSPPQYEYIQPNYTCPSAYQAALLIEHLSHDYYKEIK